MFQITTKALPSECPLVTRWCLDYPAAGQSIDANDLIEGGVIFQGWILTQDNHKAIPYVRIGDKKVFFRLEVERRDVIERVLGVSPIGHVALSCGFRDAISFDTDVVYFGADVDGLSFDLVQILVEGKLQILEGKNGWLFLDNDFNQSVEQFRGKLLLTRQSKQEWKRYLDDFLLLARENNFRQVILVAPAKEMVLPELYPFKKGATCPIEQVRSISNPEHKLVHPVKAMRESPERAFRVCDSHWTPRGAHVAFLEAVGSMEIDKTEAEKKFEDIKYSGRMISGDLGNKVYPPRESYEFFPEASNYRKFVYYDSYLPNMGRVILLKNANALLVDKCLIFGSSSSYTMLDYVARIFSEVTFVHSAGSVDMRILSLESPGYVIAQTNGRFSVRPPTITFDLEEEVSAKWHSLDSYKRIDLKSKHMRWKCKGLVSNAAYYHSLIP